MLSLCETGKIGIGMLYIPLNICTFDTKFENIQFIPPRVFKTLRW